MTSALLAPLPFALLSQRRSLPAPPRYDLWPVAVQHALKLRGALVRCGPGLRGVGWPDSPAVRLNALAPWLEGGRTATHSTAAWVWGAARDPGTPLTVSMRGGARALPPEIPGLRRYELRLNTQDRQLLGEFEVTTPLRTVIDLLHDPGPFGTAEIVACRLLLRLVEGGRITVLSHLQEHRRPHRRLALARLADGSARTP